MARRLARYSLLWLLAFAVGLLALVVISISAPAIGRAVADNPLLILVAFLLATVLLLAEAATDLADLRAPANPVEAEERLAAQRRKAALASAMRNRPQ